MNTVSNCVCYCFVFFCRLLGLTVAPVSDCFVVTGLDTEVSVFALGMLKKLTNLCR